MRSGFDVMEVARVVASGLVGYMAVHFLVLPPLQAAEVSLNTYFYTGFFVTAILSIGTNILLQKASARLKERQAHPAE